jgi:hypothetical protein
LQVFALKRSKDPVDILNEIDRQAVLDKIRLMKENPHPLIVKVVDDFLDNTRHQCMVQEHYS